MWTPKRILLLAVGFVLFTLVYLLYSATSLGRINTLPPLPEQYSEGNSSSSGDRPPRSRSDPPGTQDGIGVRHRLQGTEVAGPARS